MITSKKDLIQTEIETGTGAGIKITLVQSTIRTGLRIWFSDLDEKNGPIVDLLPFGLKGYRVTLSFGGFSREVIEQISKASSEVVQLARALISSLNSSIEVEIKGQSLSDWSVSDGSFQMLATIRKLDAPNEDLALVNVCRDAIIPMMGAMAELIGYDIVEKNEQDFAVLEGAITESVIRKRERNPRNKLLCIRIHGEICKVCGLEPRKKYFEAGSIIEVHHLEPLALLKQPRAYDPVSDLVPLCPSCHRAIHTKRPIPFDIAELKKIMGIKCD